MGTFEEFDGRDREKPSWREIDQRRDGTHRREDRSSKQAFERQRRQDALHKKELEALFDPGARLTEPQKKLLEKIRKAKTPDAIDRACQEFIDKFDYPADWDSLLLFLDCRQGDIVQPVLERLAKLSGGQNDSARRQLVQQLRILKMTAQDSKIIDMAENVLATVEAS